MSKKLGEPALFQEHRSDRPSAAGGGLEGGDLDRGGEEKHVLSRLRQTLRSILNRARPLRRGAKLSNSDRLSIDTIIGLATADDAMLRERLALLKAGEQERTGVDVASLLRGLHRALLPKAKTADVAVELSRASNDDALVAGTRKELRQALLLIAQNLVEAMGQAGGGTLGLSCRSTVSAAVVTIKGIGAWTKAKRTKEVFNSFSGTDAPKTKHNLAGLRAAIQEQNGQISVRTASEKGITVTIRLPKPSGES